MNIEDEINSCKKNSMVLEKRTRDIESLLYKGNDIILPLNLISNLLEETKQTLDKNITIIEKQQIQINKINHESIKARNQIVYMFLMIIATLLGKLIIPYLIGQ